MNNIQPLVSIGLFVYNEEKYIASTIESWLDQDYENIEIVISDNASEDKTYEIAQQYAEKDHRIILSQNNENLGSIFNSKKVFDLSKGKYFIWSSGHDSRDRKLLSTCVDVLESNDNVVLAYPQATWINEQGEIFDSIGGCIETRGLDFLSRLNVVLWGLGYAAPVYGFFRTDALKQVPLGKSIIAPDVLLLCELSVLGEFAYVPIPLLQMRRMGDYGDWNSYVTKIFNQSLSQLSVPEIFWQMLQEFVTSITKHIDNPETKEVASYLIIQGLMKKYGGILNVLSKQKNSKISQQEQVIFGKIKNLAAFLQQNNQLITTQLVGLNDDHKNQNSQLVNIPELKAPIILIDGVFFQLYRTGIARVWRSLLQQWANTNFADHILVLDRANSAPKIAGIHYLTIPAYNYHNTEGDRRMLQQICDQHSAELFISTYYTTPIYTPSVFMAYDMIPEMLGGDLNQPMWREKHKGINHASAFIAISENTAKDINKCFPEIPLESITVAHCGVDSLFTPASETEINNFKYKYGINKPYFLIGGLGGYKNSILFFQGLAQLANKQSFDIVATGAGSKLPPEWRQYTLGCTFHGLQLSDEELRLVYAGAVAFVYPSKYEGFGMPVIEAMACGCPVITTPNASLPEAGGEAVIYVADDDIEAMANALCDVQKPYLRRNLIPAGLQQAQKFSWATMAQKVRQALLDLIQPAFNLSETNYIIFPDWSTDEETLGMELMAVIKQLAIQAETQGITLLIDRTETNSEEVELILSGIAMNLMLEEGIEIPESLQISTIGELTDNQHQILWSQITARIRLTNENQEAIAKFYGDELICLNFDGDNYIVFPDWQVGEEILGLELMNIIEKLAIEKQNISPALLIDTTGITVEEANIFLSSVAINLMLEAEIDIAETLQISLLGELSEIQWQSLFPQITARIELENEDQEALIKVSKSNLPILELVDN